MINANILAEDCHAETAQGHRCRNPATTGKYCVMHWKRVTRNGMIEAICQHDPVDKDALLRILKEESAGLGDPAAFQIMLEDKVSELWPEGIGKRDFSDESGGIEATPTFQFILESRASELWLQRIGKKDFSVFDGEIITEDVLYGLLQFDSCWLGSPLVINTIGYWRQMVEVQGPDASEFSKKLKLVGNALDPRLVGNFALYSDESIKRIFDKNRSIVDGICREWKSKQPIRNEKIRAAEIVDKEGYLESLFGNLEPGQEEIARKQVLELVLDCKRSAPRDMAIRLTAMVFGLKEGTVAKRLKRKNLR